MRRTTFVALTILALGWNATLSAATYTVNSSADYDTTLPSSDDGQCTLREAVLTARGSPGPGNGNNDCPAGAASPDTIITFAPSVTTINITQGLMQVTTAISGTMVFNGNGSVIIDGAGNGGARLFSFVGTPAVSLNGLTIQNFATTALAGVIDAQGGDLTIAGCAFNGNTSQGDAAVIDFGGATLNISGSSFANNKTIGLYDGGALWLNPDTLVTINGTSFTGNEARDGGAIYIGGVGSLAGIIIDGSIFTSNKATGDGTSEVRGGGAIFNQAGSSTLELILIEHNLFTLNEATNGRGGAILNSSTGVLSWPDTLNTIGDLHAGGIFGSFFFMNKASGSGSALNGLGGAIYNQGQLSVLGSTFQENESVSSAGGAIAHNKPSSSEPDRLRVVNCTFGKNKASTNGGALEIYDSSSKARVLNSTFSENQATTGSGGGIYNESTWLDGFQMRNTIVANNTTGGNCGGAALVDQGNNLQFPALDCGATIASADPKLEALLPPLVPPAPPFPTYPLGAGSAALRAGDATTCSDFPVFNVDERLVVRPDGGSPCDIGAYESNRIAGFAPPGPIIINTTVNVQGNANAVLSENGNDNLTISAVGLTAGPELSETPPPGLPITILDDSGTTATIVVHCLSAVGGTFNGTLDVTHSAPGSPASIPVTCNVSEPGYGSVPAAPGPLTIVTNVSVAGTANLTVSETGTATLNVTSVQVLPGTPEITLTTPSSFSIANGGPSQTVTVSCLSPTPGPYTATLRVTHNGTFAGSPLSPTDYTVNCTVNAVPTPGYGSVPAAPGPLTIATSASVAGTANLTVSETGNATLNVTNVQVLPGTPEITLTTPSSFSIADGGPSQTVTVSCISPTPGPYTATLRLTHNGTFAGSPPSPTDYTVNCTVSAVPAAGYGSVPVAPGPLTIATSASVAGTANLTVSETGNATLNVTSVQVLPGTPEITLTTPSSFSIADGGPSQTVTVSCISPTAGPYTATLRVTHNGTFAGSPPSPTDYTVNCTVSAVPQPGYGSVPAAPGPLTINTPQGVSGTANLTVSETGTATLTVSNVQIVAGGAPEITLSTASSFTIPNGGASVVVTVGCQSPTAGPYTATLRVTHNGTFAGSPPSPTDYTVNCTVTSGSAPGYGSTPAPGGALTILTTVNVPNTTSVTVSETGNATLSVGPAVTGANLTLTTPASFTINDGGAAQAVTVQCLSSTMGIFTGTLSVVHNGVNTSTPATYPITCRVGTFGTPGDFDGDGKIDLLFRSQTSGTQDVWLMDDITRTLDTTTNPSVQADLNWNIVGTNDFNADGKTDLVWHHNLSGANVVWLMDGTTRITGTFTNPSTQIDPNWQMVGTGHFNGDGKPDLLWRQVLSGNVVVWFMDGLNRISGTFTTPANQPVGWFVGGTADFDGDQKTDILWQHDTTGALQVWFMNGTAMTSVADINPQLPTQKVGSWIVQATTDMNGDGSPDLVWRNIKSGRIVVWHMNGVNRIDGLFTNPSIQPLDFKIVGPR